MARPAPSSREGGRRRRLLAWGVLGLVLCGPAKAAQPKESVVPPGTPEHWRANGACPRDQVAPRDYNRCLYDVRRSTEEALEAEVANAMAVIDSRVDLVAVQRARWKNLLDESQSRFLIFRNFDCQSVAPYEGPRGIGNFEQRTLCLIEANMRRAHDLRARYGDVPKEAVPLKGEPETRSSAWIYPAPPPLE